VSEVVYCSSYSPVCVCLHSKGVILRDHRRVSAAVRGLCDGLRLRVEVLEVPQVLEADHLLLCVRELRVKEKRLLAPKDLVLNKTQTVADMYREVRTIFPHLCESESPNSNQGLSIAKAPSFGPPLTFQSSLKLKWNDPAVRERINYLYMYVCWVSGYCVHLVYTEQWEGSATVFDAPLSLRDGSILLVRSYAPLEVPTV
jgi:hypothetical protein